MWRRPTPRRSSPRSARVDGVWVQGGTDGVIRALLAAKRPLVPVAGEAENGFRQDMLNTEQGIQGHLDRPAAVPGAGLAGTGDGGAARQARQGQYHHPLPHVTQDTVKEGETTFKNLPSSFFADFTDSGPHATCAASARMPPATKGRSMPRQSLKITIRILRPVRETSASGRRACRAHRPCLAYLRDR